MTHGGFSFGCHVSYQRKSWVSTGTDKTLDCSVFRRTFLEVSVSTISLIIPGKFIERVG
jgi:hypothetical protein